MPDSRPQPRALPRFLQLLALATFAFAQPLLDIVRRHPQFLVVNRADWTDLAFLVLLLVLVPPLLLWLLVMVVDRLDRRAGTAIHGIVLAFLLAVTLVPVLDSSPACDGYVTLGAALACAAAGWWAFRRLTPVRENLALLALTVPVFVGLFVFSDGVRTAVGPAEWVGHGVGPATESVPVVLVILDELPLATLLDSESDVDDRLFPNFSRLAAQATWYPRTAAVSGATLRAVPSILTGRFSDWDQPPNLGGHPENLFTVLGPTHRILAAEAQTALCPAEYASQPDSISTGRFSRLLDDVSVLMRHVLYPREFRTGLPPIGNKWNDFAGEDRSSWRNIRHGEFRTFVDGIERSDEPLLAVIHTLLPHNPFRHYPNGRIYKWREIVDHTVDGVWIDDPLAIRDSYRRHLVQTVSVDRLLGELLDRLEAQGVLDETMLVVTADHGACFSPGQPMRKFSEENVHDLMSVPMFIKYPGQDGPRRDNRYAQTVDIYPTILETLGVTPPDGLDGRSLVDREQPERTTLVFLDQDGRVRRDFPVSRLDDRGRTDQWKDRAFQDLASVVEVYGVGAPREMLGKSLTDLPLGAPLDLTLTLDEPARFQNVRSQGLYLPGEITGTVEPVPDGERIRLAVAVDGRLAGVNESYRCRDGSGRCTWSILLPDSVLHPGTNTIEVLHLDETGVLRPLVSTAVSYLGERLGARPNRGVPETGFHTSELWDGTPFRWTDGRAHLSIPLLRQEQPDSLAVELVSTGPQGTRLEILVDQRRLFEGELARGPWKRVFGLHHVRNDGNMEIEIVSGTFGPGDGDRILGVGVAAVEVRDAGF